MRGIKDTQKQAQNKEGKLKKSLQTSKTRTKRLKKKERRGKLKKSFQSCKTGPNRLLQKPLPPSVEPYKKISI